MRPVILAACAALLLGLSPQIFGQQASAQPAAAPPSVVPPAATGPAPQIVWEVKNRFRLFRNDADFQKHVAAYRAGTIFAAEQKLARDTDGRGWAKDMFDKLCVDGSGKLTQTCQRDGERENYLTPDDHRVVVKLTGAVPAGATCNWSFDDGTIPPQAISAPCADEVRLRLRYGKPTIAAAGIVLPDQSVDSVTTEIRVRDLLIAGIGDSVAAGEGNPDRAVALSDDGYCFRRFLGSSASEYFRPSRAGFQGLKACDDTPGGPGRDTITAWSRAGARWMSAACHRSLYSYQLRTALALAIENPQVAVTFVPLACTGATIDSGLLGSQRASDCPLTGNCATSVQGQIAQLQDLLNTAKKQNPNRGLDLILLTIGANDIKFSGLVADVIMQSGVERSIFSQGGMLTGLPESQKLLASDLPAGFTKLRTSLKPFVGGNLSRVVYVAYGNPALQNDQSCPGGRDGLDVHPAFNADAQRLKYVSEYVSDKFLPRLKQLARCEAGTICRDPSTDMMTFVDSHQAAFAQHGFCARSDQDPDFDRECFSEKGESFDSDPVSAATQPLVCDRRPSEFKPYAARKRWVRTANDSYFTAMTFPQGMPTTMQPANLHDATWGAMSAVYGGAIHPTAEGHAAMADAALPAVRQVLGLQAPAEVTSEPLPPPEPVAR
jgi:hypothetical protein